MARDRAITPDPVFASPSHGKAGAWRGRSRATALAGALLLLAVALLVVRPAHATAQDRSQSYGTVDIDAALAEDGALQVVERREVDYRGQWNGERYELPLRGGQQVSLRSVSDGRGTQYVPGACSPDGARQPGAYELLGDDGRFVIAVCWDPPPRDTTRELVLEYTVTGAGERHEDASELFWQFIGAGWDAPTDEVVVDVALPTDDVRFWAHGPLNGQVEQVAPGRLRMTVSDLRPATFVELRALMPAAALAAAPSTGRLVRDDILAEEACLAQQANADRARARGEEPTEDCDPQSGFKLALTATLGLLTVGGGVGWWQLFRRHGREYPLPADVAATEYEHDLPSDHPPAHVDYLLAWGDVRETALTATVLDLARRGHVRLRRELRTTERAFLPDREEAVTIFERRSAPERPYELDVMELLFDRAGGGRGTVTDRQLKQWVEEHRSEAYRWWQSWTAAVTRSTSGERWIESTGWVAASIALGVMLVGAGVGAAILGAGLVAAAVAVVAGIALAAASPLMRRRTPDGRVLEHRWRRFGAYLTDYSLIPERGPEYLALWGHWLVYAVPLGVAEKVVQNLETRLSRAELEQVGGGWYPMMYHHGYLYGGFGDGLSAVTTAIPTNVIASSPESSGGGAGGGFSGGGGGGGGGSGGGGF